MVDTQAESTGALSVPPSTALPQFERSVSEENEVGPQLRRYRKFRCHFRRFSSKSAFMVLIWSVITNTMYGTLSNLYFLFHLYDIASLSNVIFITTVPVTALVVVALLSGWLADVYTGHYRMVKIGIVFMFISAVLLCLLVVAVRLSDTFLDLEWRVVLFSVTASLVTSSTAVLLVNLPQVGLDQMPDSSTESITSYIIWYVGTFFAGFWIGSFTSRIGYTCFGEDFVIVFNLLPVGLLALVLISDIFLTSKWLIIEPKSLQSLKIMYKILIYAKQHKSPVNRSAFTYCEGDVPSRIDFGKSKYGGPFTTEQVENVKTIFRILSLSIPLWISILSFFLYANVISLLNANPIVSINGTEESCSSKVLQWFTYNWYLWAVILIVIFEFIIYPLISHRLPSSLRRICASTLMTVVANTLSFFLTLYYSLNPSHYVPIVISYLHFLGVSVIFLAFLTSSVEFVCAQTPYNMRGLLLGYIWCMTFSMFTLADFIYYAIKSDDPSIAAVLVHGIAAVMLSFIGFVVFCALARWYKRRVRDDIPVPHQWAEEYYDRYLSSVTLQ